MDKELASYLQAQKDIEHKIEKMTVNKKECLSLIKSLQEQIDCLKNQFHITEFDYDSVDGFQSRAFFWWNSNKISLRAKNPDKIFFVHEEPDMFGEMDVIKYELFDDIMEAYDYGMKNFTHGYFALYNYDSHKK